MKIWTLQNQRNLQAQQERETNHDQNPVREVVDSDEEDDQDEEGSEEEEASATSGLRRLLSGQAGRGQAVSI